MSSLLLGFVKWIARHLRILVLTLAILLCGTLIKIEWIKASEAKKQQVQLEAERSNISSELLNAANTLEQKLRSEVASENGLINLQNSINDSIRVKKAERNNIKKEHGIAVNLPATKEFRRVAVLDMEISMLDQAQSKASELSNSIDDLTAGKNRVRALRLEKYHAQMKAYENRLEQSSIHKQHPYALLNPFSFYYKRIKALETELPNFEKHVTDTQSRIEIFDFTNSMNQRKFDESRHKFLAGYNSVENAIAMVDEKIAANKQVLMDSFFVALQDNFWPTVKGLLPKAFGVLLSLIFLPIGIKIFLYYLVAPWASRQQPICIIPNTGKSLANNTNSYDTQLVKMQSSGISLPIKLKEDDELLLHSDYIQSTSSESKKSTKWVLDWNYLFASLAAGMYALTRILSHNQESVVISSTKDAMMEVAAIELPEGTAIVLQPHSLIGIVQKLNQPARITSHWRLWHLHSWLTLQLRYLVFHGPATLIIKGCRGVRLEPVGAGRSINQAATLGFSADVKYSVNRSETFASYWRSEQGLFIDHFAGESGIFIYEEIPSMSRKSGVTGRSFEGLTDAVLKVFGI